MTIASRKPGGFTLVELLVVITIIGILVALLMPAVQSARESARLVTCKNNLYQLGDAAQQHMAKWGFFPSGGWGYMWTGDPDMGYGKRQPGGWLYSSLPFLGLDNIHDLAKGQAAGTKFNTLGQMRGVGSAIFICPTRRKVMGYPPTEASYNAAQPPSSSKTDYAANAGTLMELDSGPDASCTTSYPNCSGGWNSFPPVANFDGAIARRSEVTAAQIVDGMQQTIYAAEKFLQPGYYYTGSAGSDNNSAYEGYDWDTERWVTNPQAADSNDAARQPMHDVRGGSDCQERFGSAHYAGFNVVFCDGSCRLLSFSIDLRVFGRLGVRNDKLVIDPSKY
jgi:prepilin-type N-terminal cleavage/methylation domain-containing protein